MRLIATHIEILLMQQLFEPVSKCIRNYLKKFHLYQAISLYKVLTNDTTLSSRGTPNIWKIAWKESEVKKISPRKLSLLPAQDINANSTKRSTSCTLSRDFKTSGKSKSKTPHLYWHMKAEGKLTRTQNFKCTGAMGKHKCNCKA